ncbi:hypothetical protein HaLaN_00057, partial [Haematococcus lacustris]
MPHAFADWYHGGIHPHRKYRQCDPIQLLRLLQHCLARGDLMLRKQFPISKQLSKPNPQATTVTLAAAMMQFRGARVSNIASWVLAPLQANNVRSEGLNGRPSDDRSSKSRVA